jgi:DNA-binding MarR family transcriptional regulator
MSAHALQACMDRHLEHAAMVFALDDALGTHHGLSWADFVLLSALEAAAGSAPATELARTLRTPASHFLLRLLPLEKTGLVERIAGAGGKRCVTLRPQGRRLLREARETAAHACAAQSPR